MFLGIFLVLHPEKNTEASAKIFDVEIAGPVFEDAAIPGEVQIPVLPVSPPEKKYEDNDIPPETMAGEGTDIKRPEVYSADRYAGFPDNKEEAAVSAGKEGTSSKDMDTMLPEGEKGNKLNPRYFLFDRGTVEKYARKGIDKKKVLSFDIPELHYRGYKRRLKSRIESAWEYPPGVIVPGTFVDLNITFSIKRDGSLGDIKLVRTSGYEALDKAALKALRDAAPYWPLPDDWEGDELIIPGHFIYLLGRSLIM